ncbi:M24 family metallopeptidase [Streptomyces sp. Lzd4kr]|nr:M24 family metallopeptidase [Streptomyces sp. Lzd4kr]
MYAWPTTDQQALHQARQNTVTDLMGRLDVDHLLLTGFDNIRYVTGFRTQIIAEAHDWFAAITDAEMDCEIFVPWVEETTPDPDPGLPGVRALHPMPSWAPAVPHGEYWTRRLASVLRRRGARRVGVEMLWGEILDELRHALPHVEFVPATTALHDARLIKHPVEIELLAAASHVNARAAEAAMASACPGMRDHDVLATAMQTLQSAGVEFLSHSLCNLGRGSGTWFAAGSELREGDAYFFDIGCYGAGGYSSDMARTGFVGTPPTTVQKAYARLLDAHRIGEDAARAGVRASEVHEAVNGFLRSHGMPITPYAMGHGVGLRACELPTIHRADRMARDQVLREGMVISLEPETSVEVDGRPVLLKVEDNYVVESTGLRRLTDAHYFEC